MGMNKDRSYSRILVARLDRIGDVILSTPVFKNIRNAFPESYIAVMVRPYARQIVEGNPYIDEVLLYDKSGKESGLLGNINFISRLRSKRFDLAIALHPTVRTHLVTALAGIPERVGYDSKWGALLTRRVPHTKQFGLKHELDYNLDLLRYIGLDPRDRELYMPTDSASEKKISDIFMRSGITDSDMVVAVNPSASCRSKRWRVENFAKVADYLARRHGAKIVVMGSPDDKIFGERVSSTMEERCLDLSGQTSISDVASILRRSKLFISNDSGPVHIACAVGTPVIDIFGRSDKGLSPKRWGPVGARSIVLHKDVGCGVCLAHNCDKNFKCIESITSGEVIEASDRLLRS